MTKTALSEKEKIHILNLVNQHGHQWKYISEIVNRKPETVKAIYNSYTKFQTISPKRGRSVKITEEVKYNIVQTMKNNPLQNLQDVATEFDVAKSSVKSILNENKIQYFKRTPICPLTFQHKQKRYQICSQITSVPPSVLPPIIFTDESTVCVNNEGGGIIQA